MGVVRKSLRRGRVRELAEALAEGPDAVTAFVKRHSLIDRDTGCEIEPRYFDIACRRIEEAYRQPRLFAEPRPQPVQEVML